MKLKQLYQKIRVVLSLLFLLSSISVVAQSQKTVTGTVLAASDNMPLPGASVLVKGTANGTSTDFDGKFSLSVSNNGNTLVISYIGYVTQELAITSDPITVRLEADENILDEVVVVGYGTQKKSDIVNAVATADLTKATLTPTSDVNEMLRGRIAGLQVDVGGGTLRPGGTSDIIFRGRASIEGNVSAIYVVDGIIRRWWNRRYRRQ